MTPELKTACELVFQEHKLSGQPVKWDRDAFRGRISIGLSEMAKETLVKKNIILLPNKSKKIFTQLNPFVADAGSFEEAEKIIVKENPELIATKDYDARIYIADHVIGNATKTRPVRSQIQVPFAITPEVLVGKEKWYLKPLYLYIVWPLCGAAAGAIISRMMDLASSIFF